MLKKMSIKKIMVSTSALFILLLIYLIPDSSKELNLKNDEVEYVYNNTQSTIYLLDSNDYVARTTIASCKCEKEELAKDLLEGLTIEGGKSNIIPNGFRSIIPPGTSVLHLKLEDKVLTIDFSKELLDISKEKEESLIEAITYTMTSIDGIDKIVIKIEGSELKTLPKTKENLPTYLDKSYGINKTYDLITTNNIDYYTVYYVNEYNDNKYYVPVTKYTNSKVDDPIKVIIRELSSSPIYETNLMSYLNSEAKLMSYELLENNLKLNFNDLLLNDINSKKILEEVIYTISLSVNDIYDNLEKVSFLVNNEEIYSINIDDLK